MITSVGSAVFIRQTRARWFYLYKSRVSSVSKKNLWRMIDMGEVRISYVENKKYRTKQRKMRTLDLREQVDMESQVEKFEDFADFARVPFDIIFLKDENRCSIDIGVFVEKIEQKGLKYSIHKNIMRVTE